MSHSSRPAVASGDQDFVRRPLPPRRLPPICQDVISDIIGINELIEKFTVTNQVLSAIDMPHINNNEYKVEIVMSRNVLRDPTNYIKMTVVEEFQGRTDRSTVVFRSRDLMRQVFLDKMQDIYNHKTDDFIFYSYGQDDNTPIMGKELVYETDDDELGEAETALSDRFLRIIYSMMSHTVPVCSNCRRVHNPRRQLNEDINRVLNNDSLNDSISNMFLDSQEPLI